MKVLFFEKHKNIKWIFLLLFVLTIFTHFGLSLQKAEQSSNVSESVTEVIVDVYNDVTNNNVTIEEAHGIIRKIVGHFMWFGLIGIFGYFTFISFIYKRYIFANVIGLVSGIFIAIGSELLQKVASGRSCEFKDMMIDFSGYSVAFAILIGIYVIVKTIKMKKVSA